MTASGYVAKLLTVCRMSKVDYRNKAFFFFTKQFVMILISMFGHTITKTRVRKMQVLNLLVNSTNLKGNIKHMNEL